MGVGCERVHRVCAFLLTIDDPTTCLLARRASQPHEKQAFGPAGRKTSGGMNPTLLEPTRTQEPQGPRLTVVEHLEELRRRLALCLVTLLAASCILLWRADRVIAWLKRPAGDLLPWLAYFSPTEALAAYVKVAVVGGVAFASPVILYQVWAFVRPGLTARERWVALAFIGWGSALFALGASAGYWLCLPVFLRFLLSVGSPHLAPVISVSRYLSFVLSVLATCGVLCELPLIIFVLTWFGLITPEMLRRRRGVALLILLVIAAIVTPTTDALSLLLTFLPIVVLYELSILVAGFSARRTRLPE